MNKFTQKIQGWGFRIKNQFPFKKIISALAYILKGYVMAVAVLLLLQRYFIYHPTDNQVSDPTSYGADYVRYQSSAGEIISWYCPPQNGKPILVMFHGNAGNISYRSLKQAFFCMKGYGFLLAEYRGYNGNEGRPYESGLYEDARAAINWLRAQGIAEDDLVIYGESIGAGVAMQMALEYEGAAGLILEAPFSDVRAVIRDVMPWLYPFSFLVLDRYDNLSKISRVQMPLQILHGDNDRIIPIAHAHALLSKADPKTASLVVLQGGGHNNLTDYGLLDNMLGFVENLNRPVP